MIPQLIGVSIIIFIIAEFMPGDALGILIDDPTMDPARIQQMRIDAGIYDPMWTRYITWVTNMFRGDFGRSLTWRRPVIELVGERLSNTMLMSTMALIMLYLWAVPIGLIAGRFRGKLPDKIISFYNFIQMSFPTIVFAVILLWVFAIILQWFPLSGSRDALLVHQSWWVVMRDRIWHAFLPAFASSVLGGVSIVQFLGNEVN